MAEEKSNEKNQESSEEEIKKYVLVTGASRGIGKEFCTRLAQRGYSIVLVARTKEDLKKNADEIKSKYGVDAIAIQADLKKSGVARSVNEGLRKRGISLHGLVNNAGFGRIGRFDELSIDEYKDMIQVNDIALVEFTYEFLYDVRDSNGFIINVASLAGIVPVPYMAVYSATKSFVINFTESLYGELSNKPRMLVLCPGATESEFHSVASKGSSGYSKMKMQSADEVVLAALNKINARNTRTIPGLSNKVAACFSKIVPSRTLARIAGNVTRKGMQ